MPVELHWKYIYLSTLRAEAGTMYAWRPKALTAGTSYHILVANCVAREAGPTPGPPIISINDLFLTICIPNRISIFHYPASYLSFRTKTALFYAQLHVAMRVSPISPKLTWSCINRLPRLYKVYMKRGNSGQCFILDGHAS